MLGKNCLKKGKKDLEIEIFCRGHQLEIGFLDTFFYDLPHVISYSIPKHSKCHSNGLFQALSTNFCVFQLEKNIVY